MSNQRYEIKHQIRKGRTGGVYEAFDTVLERSVILRRFYTQNANSPTDEQLVRFQECALRFTSLLHPNILTVLEASADESGPYIISEMEEGVLLSEHIERRGPLNQHEVFQLAQQLTDALLAAHQKGVIHGALSARSVLMNSNGLRGPSFKLIDLGLNEINHIFDTDDSPVSDLADPSIMAPELFDGHNSSEIADIFATGQICYLALAGGNPNIEKNPSLIQQFYLQNRQPHISEYAIVEPAFASWIHHLINPVPSLRPPSFAEVLSELTTFFVTPDLSSSPALQAIPTEQGVHQFQAQPSQAQGLPKPQLFQFATEGAALQTQAVAERVAATISPISPQKSNKSSNALWFIAGASTAVAVVLLIPILNKRYATPTESTPTSPAATPIEKVTKP